MSSGESGSSRRKLDEKKPGGSFASRLRYDINWDLTNKLPLAALAAH
jgi:hypothetical protein